MTGEKENGSKRELGFQYEEEAVRYLKDQGYRILCRNFSCRQGEIDIVAKEGCYLCFVEVKYRGTARWGRQPLCSGFSETAADIQNRPVLSRQTRIWDRDTLPL